MDTDHKSREPLQSDRWWFPDGNIILQANEPATLFRVHQGMLSLHSAIFRDMFEHAQPAHGETFGGLPLVHLSDTALELHHFLMALWDWTAYLKAQCTDFEVFVDCLRLSTKYDVAPLRKHAVGELSNYYPTKLATWEQSLLYGHLDCLITKAIVVVQLVRELSLPLSMLPAAYFECCQAGDTVKAIFDGCRFASGRLYQLGPADLQACLVGYERLAIRKRMETQALYVVHCASCSNPDSCREVLVKAIQESAATQTAMQGLDVKMFARPNLEGSCEACTLAFERHFDAAGTRIWTDLPAIFELGTWSDLENARSD